MAASPVPPIPVQGYLVPEPQALAPDGFTTIDQKIVNGLPTTIQLDAVTSLVFALPSGLALAWRDAAASSVVSASADERAPDDPSAPATDVGAHAPGRIALRRGGATLAVVPLAAGLRRTLPEGDTSDGGMRIELIILGWIVTAGSVRGSGDFGSRIMLAWRRADRATDHFTPPAINPYVLSRLPVLFRLESDLTVLWLREQPVMRKVTAR